MNRLTNFFIASETNNYRPLVLNYKAFIVYGLILLLLRIFLGTLSTEGAAVESNTLMNLISEERLQRNLGSLITDSRLLKAAAEKSQDMIDRDYFAHVDPDGNYVWNRIAGAGYYPYKILGENLALDFATSEGMIKAWLDSPSHRANLLHPDFRDQGLSALYGDYQGRYTNLTASLFGTLAIASPQPTPTPPPQVKSDTTTPPPATPPPTPPLPKPAPPAPPPSPAKISTTTTGTNTNTTKTPAPVEENSSGQSGNLGGPASPIRIYPSVFEMSRVIFTLFGILLLMILAVDSIIISRHELVVLRSRSSYHFFGFMLIVLVSILIWWW